MLSVNVYFLPVLLHNAAALTTTPENKRFEQIVFDFTGELQDQIDFPYKPLPTISKKE